MNQQKALNCGYMTWLDCLPIEITNETYSWPAMY